MMMNSALQQSPYAGSTRLKRGRDYGPTHEEIVRVGSLVRLSHLAWVLTELVRTGVVLSREGWCLGVTLPADTVMTRAGMTRARSIGVLRLWHLLLSYVHGRWFHDAGCETTGVSRRLLRRWIRSARSVRGGELLEEAYVAAVGEVIRMNETERSAYEAWSQVHGEVSAEDIFMLHVRSVITPEPPWDVKGSSSGSSRTLKRVIRRKKY